MKVDKLHYRKVINSARHLEYYSIRYFQSSSDQSNLEKINEELDDRFCQISRGIIINKNLVRHISSSGQVVMTNGQIFITSAKKIKELKDEL